MPVTLSNLSKPLPSLPLEMFVFTSFFLLVFSDLSFLFLIVFSFTRRPRKPTLFRVCRFYLTLKIPCSRYVTPLQHYQHPILSDIPYSHEISHSFNHWFVMHTVTPPPIRPYHISHKGIGPRSFLLSFPYIDRFTKRTKLKRPKPRSTPCVASQWNGAQQRAAGRTWISAASSSVITVLTICAAHSFRSVSHTADRSWRERHHSQIVKRGMGDLALESAKFVESGSVPVVSYRCRFATNVWMSETLVLCLSFRFATIVSGFHGDL